ncbi:hypothetical protein ACE6H2_026760 [Prunus campanulata]
MVSESQNKEAEASKAKAGSMAQGDEPKTGSVEVEKSTQSKPSKRMRFSSTSEIDSSTATFVEEPKSGRGYVGLTDQLVETMPEGQEIDRAVLWKKAREDKTGNIPDPKAAEKAKLIDDLQKQVSEGTLTVSGSNDILTLALGTPEHGGRVRGAGAGVTPTQFFNLPKQQRVKFGDKLKESVREAVREETLRIEAKSRETIMEAVRAEKEAMLAFIRQLVPNFDPSQMLQTPISPRTPIPPIILPPQDQSPKNPMSDKASCSGATNIRPLALELEDRSLKLILLQKRKRTR